MVQEDTKELLAKVDEFETKIRLVERLTKEYNDLKKEIKSSMVNLANTFDVEQLKWTTPNGIKLTLSVGHQEFNHKEVIEEFDLETFKKENEELYKKYLVEKNKTIVDKNATSDTLKITLPKEVE